MQHETMVPYPFESARGAKQMTNLYRLYIAEKAFFPPELWRQRYLPVAISEIQHHAGKKKKIGSAYPVKELEPEACGLH